MRPGRSAAVLVVIVVLLTALTRPAGAATLRGVTIDRALEDDPLSVDLPRTVPTIVRLSVVEATPETREATLKRLDDVLRVYQDRNIQVVLALGTLPTTDTAVETWKQFIRAVAERARGKVVAYQLG